MWQNSKNICRNQQKRGVSVSGYLKASLVEIASAVERILLPVDPNFEKDQTSDADKLVIHDMVIPDQFSLKTVNNFNSSPPFGLYDIFNCLIYHSTDYDKRRWLCGIITNRSVESRGCSRIRSQSAAVHEDQNG